MKNTTKVSLLSYLPDRIRKTYLRSGRTDDRINIRRCQLLPFLFLLYRIFVKCKPENGKKVRKSN